MAKLRELDREKRLELARDAKTDEELFANLLGAWHAAPNVGVFGLLEVASARVAKEVEPEDFLAAASRRDVRELPALIAGVQAHTSAVARERAEALATWPMDPRTAPGLLQLVLRSQLRGRTTRPFWTIVFRIIHRRFHPGVAAAVAAIDAAELGGDFGDYVQMKLESIRRRLASASASDEEEGLDPAASMLVAQIRAKLGIDEAAAAAKSLQQFIEEIWAAPLDDGLREVFADWLRDDPRAELIMLQLTRRRRGLDAAAQKREAALLKAHARAWMGPLDPVVDRKAWRFEGGFLHACKVDARQLANLPALMTHPAWATVREYQLDTRYDGPCDAFLDHMIALGAKRK